MNITTILDELHHTLFLDNHLDKVVVFFLILGLGLLSKRLFSKTLGKLIFSFFRRFSEEVSIKVFLELLQKPIERLVTVLIIYLATKNLTYPSFMSNYLDGPLGASRWVGNVYEGAFIVCFTWIVLRLLDFGLIVIKNHPEYGKEKMNIQLFPFFKEFLKIVVVVISFFFILGAVFDLNVGSIIAGLGIGGLAVALAGKETLENLLASFTIFVDKPFIVGDLIQVGSTVGIVEKVGFRSTRIRTLERSVITIPNKQLVDQPLDNQANRQSLRVRQNLFLAYQTPNAAIQEFCIKLKERLLEQPFLEENALVKFNEFSNRGADVLVQYFVKTNDFATFMEHKTEVNFLIKSTLEELGIVLEAQQSK